jgi:hypothetical protein
MGRWSGFWWVFSGWGRNWVWYSDGVTAKWGGGVAFGGYLGMWRSDLYRYGHCKLVENRGNCAAGGVVWCSNSAAAILTAFNCVATCGLIYTILLTSQHPPYARHLLSKWFFEYLKGNISLFDLCGCGTWSLTLRAEHRLRGVGEYIGPKRDERIGERRKRRNEEVHDLYC